MAELADSKKTSHLEWEDIRDLSPVGGSWESIISLLYDKESDADTVRTFIKKGTLAGRKGLVQAYLVEREVEEPIAPKHPRVVAALIIALDHPDERSRASSIFVRSWPAGSPTASSFIFTNNRSRLWSAPSVCMGTHDS